MRLEPDLRDFVDGERQRVGGQAVAEARQRVDQRRAMRVVVDQHDRLRAAGFAIGGEQRAQPAHQRVGRRQRIGGGAGRADGGALPATGADMGVDRDVIAGGRDGAGRAEVEAAGAADDLGARMRAEVLGEGDVARLVEGADEVARLEHRLEHGGRIAGVGAQVAVAQIGRGEQRRAAGDVEHEIALRHRAVAAGAEAQRAARRRRRLRIVVDRELEGAEMALGGADRAPHHGKIGDPRRRHVGGRLDQHRHVEVVLEQVGRLDCLLVAAVNEDHALAGEADEGDLGRCFLRRRDQRRHLRAGRLGVLRPAGGLADVHVFDVEAFGLRGLREQRGFLGAADDERLAGRPPRRGTARARPGRAGARSDRLAPRQPRRTVSASSGIVSSHEQMKMFCGRSAMWSPVIGRRAVFAMKTPSHRNSRDLSQGGDVGVIRVRG